MDFDLLRVIEFLAFEATLVGTWVSSGAASKQAQRTGPRAARVLGVGLAEELGDGSLFGVWLCLDLPKLL